MSRRVALAKVDSVRDTRRVQREGGYAVDVLQRASACWSSLRDMRATRDRCIRYLYGDQWGDEIRDNGMVCCTEREAISQDGGVPLTTNLIRKLVRTMVGVYRNQNSVPSATANDREEQSLGEVMSVTLQANWKNNYKKELDARCFEDFLAGGVAVQKETYGWNAERQKEDAWSWWPNVNRMFWDPDTTDPRNWDMELVGEIHDWPMGKVCEMFGVSAKDAKRLRQIYGRCMDREWLSQYWWDIGLREEEVSRDNIDFFLSHSPRLCRVIEVWTRESKMRYHVWDTATGEMSKCELVDEPLYQAENARRIAEGAAVGLSPAEVALVELIPFVDRYWYYRFMAPTGEVLEEGESPYDHGSHPYVIKMYPMTNGEIHSFVGDVIDQQRYVNRMISLNDKLIRSAAKGVLLFPTSMIPDGKTPEDIAREWRDPDSVIFFDDEKNRISGARPEQYVNKLVNIGTMEMTQMMMGMIDEVSGVNGALRGETAFAGQSATHLAQQTTNASISILDIIETYNDLILRGAEKKLKNMQQYYDTVRTAAIAGRGEVVSYDPALCGDMDFDLNMGMTPDTPASRMLNNDILMTLFQMGAINVVQLLENGNWPFTDRLLESLRAVASGQVSDPRQAAGVLGEARDAMAEAGAGGDSEAVSQAQQLMQNYPTVPRGDVYRSARAGEADKYERYEKD